MRTKAKLHRRRFLGKGLAATLLAGCSGIREVVPDVSDTSTTGVAAPAGLQMQLIRNATVKFKWAGGTLLIDPFLAARNAGVSFGGAVASPLVDLPFSVDEILHDTDGIFVSHLHADHFDKVARETLPRAIPLLCPSSIAGRIRGFGFSDVTGFEANMTWRGASLTLTGGRHGPDAVLADTGAVNGLIIRVSGAKPLYWVGDSIWCDEVRLEIDKHQPATIVAHACGASWKGIAPLVMDEQHVEAMMRYAHQARVVATHMDCVDHATVSREALNRHFSTLPELRRRLSIPADGEVLRFT